MLTEIEMQIRPLLTFPCYNIFWLILLYFTYCDLNLTLTEIGCSSSQFVIAFHSVLFHIELMEDLIMSMGAQF